MRAKEDYGNTLEKAFDDVHLERPGQELHLGDQIFLMQPSNSLRKLCTSFNAAGKMLVSSHVLYSAPQRIGAYSMQTFMQRKETFGQGSWKASV